MKRKVKAAGSGGAIATILIFVLQQLNVELPADVAAAIATLLAVVVGYVVPEAE